MSQGIRTALWGSAGPTKPPLRFLLWVPERDVLRFHRIAPRRSTEALVLLTEALEWLDVHGEAEDVWADEPSIDTSGRIQAFVHRRDAERARVLFDEAAERFGLLWFDPENDEDDPRASLRRFDGRQRRARRRCTRRRSWLLLETIDRRGPFVELDLEGGMDRASSHAPTESALGATFTAGRRAQLRLLGWVTKDRHAYGARLGVKDEGERRRAAEVLLRTLETVYGVSPGEPMALRFRAEDASPDAA
ncbi:MAG: hypothetical protein R3A78_03905 [Polyangiales bacterium]